MLLLQIERAARVLLLLLLRAALLIEARTLHAEVVVSVHIVVGAILLLLLVVLVAQALVIHARRRAKLIQTNRLRVAVRVQLGRVIIHQAGRQPTIVRLLTVLTVAAGGRLVAVWGVVVGLAGLGGLRCVLGGGG